VSHARNGDNPLQPRLKIDLRVLRQLDGLLGQAENVVHFQRDRGTLLQHRRAVMQRVQQLLQLRRGDELPQRAVYRRLPFLR